MLAWIKKLLWDEEAFVGTARMVLLGLGGAIAAGQLPLPAGWEWLGAVLMGLSGRLTAGQKNPKVQA